MLLAMLAAAAAIVIGEAGPTTQGKAAETGAVPVEKVSAKDKVVCRLDENTGSRIASQVCHTQAQWDRLERDAQGSLHEMSKGGAPVCKDSGSC